jgi:MFS family permease
MGGLATDRKRIQMMTTVSLSDFFGWKVVVTAFIVATFTFGVGYYGPPVFLNVLHQQRGWPVSLVSSAITVHFLVSALLVTRLPAAHQRFGIASITIAGTAVLAIGMLCWSMACAPWHLFAAATISGTGWAATSGAAIIAMVSPWFDRRRAIALGHALNGTSVGGVLFAPLWVTLIAAVGFTPAVALVGMGMCVVLGPLIWRYLRPTPASLGLAPDGGNAASYTPNTVPASHPAGSVTALYSSLAFATLSASFALGMFAQVGTIAHLMTRLSPILGPADAAAALSVTTASAVIGRMLLGTVLGDADRRMVAAANFVIQACGVTLLAVGRAATMIVPGCILFGLGVGNLLTLLPLIAQREFPPETVFRVVALVTAVNQALFAFAPATFGILREVSGSYVVPFLTAAVVQVLAAFLIVLGRRPAPASQLARD